MRIVTLCILSLCITLNGFPFSAGFSKRSSCPTSCRKYDEFALLSYDREKLRLDEYANQLKEESGVVAVVIVQPGGTLPFKKAQARARRTIDYLVNKRGVDPGRVGVVTLKKAQQEFSMELWLCPFFAAQELLGMYEGRVITGKEIKKNPH